MEGQTEQGAGRLPHCQVLYHVELTRKLATQSQIVPNPDGAVFLGGGGDDRPLDARVEARDITSVEARAEELKGDLLLHGLLAETATGASPLRPSHHPILEDRSQTRQA